VNIVGIKADFLDLDHAMTQSRDDELLVRVIAEVMLDGELNRQLCLRGVAGKEA